MIKTIDFKSNIITIDGQELQFPLSINEIKPLLGEPEIVTNKDDIHYIYHDQGIVFTGVEQNDKWLKSRKRYIDKEHNIIYVCLYCGDVVRPMSRETALPKSCCKAKITAEGRNFWFISDRAEVGEFHMIRWPDMSIYDYKPNGEEKELVDPLSVSFQPPRPHGDVSYKIKPCKEEVLEFDNFNFKLAIIQVLMYDLEVLEPFFDIYDFAQQYDGKPIDTESEKPIRPALNFFKKLPIPKRLAALVEEIDMDGGNEIYANIIPVWDGEDEFFDLNIVSEKELKQFPNLKKATIMSENYDAVAKVFVEAGVEVDRI